MRRKLTKYGELFTPAKGGRRTTYAATVALAASSAAALAVVGLAAVEGVAGPGDARPYAASSVQTPPALVVDAPATAASGVVPLQGTAAQRPSAQGPADVPTVTGRDGAGSGAPRTTAPRVGADGQSEIPAVVLGVHTQAPTEPASPSPTPTAPSTPSPVTSPPTTPAGPTPEPSATDSAQPTVTPTPGATPDAPAEAQPTEVPSETPAAPLEPAETS